MSIKWRGLCREARLPIDGSAIKVRFADERGHTVYVDNSTLEGDAVRVWAVAARPSAVEGMSEPESFAAFRNRRSDVVGFKLDRKGRLIGEAWIPADGLDAEEWGVYVRAVAQACDWLEYQLTGRDEL